ncbi:MAG: PAS domain S-box-containing protein [Planctomycetota bacterium]|jgi:PAS domain S-box-containing protein
MIKDEDKTPKQLVDELNKLRLQVAEQRTGEMRPPGKRAALREMRQRLHGAAGKMQRSDGIRDVLSMLAEGLRRLEIPFQYCGINLIDNDIEEVAAVNITGLGRDGVWKGPDQVLGQDLVYQFWQSGAPVYRRDLEAEDLYDEQEACQEYLGQAVRCILDIPFAHGTLAVSSEAPGCFSPEHIDHLEELAFALEYGFKRREDLRTLEQRNRELEAEVVQRQQVETDLIDSREQIRTIIDTVVDPIITINDRGVIESANSSLVKVFGYRPEEVLGQNVKILMPEPYRNEYDGYLNRYLNTNEKQIIDVGSEVMGRRKDGTVFPMDLAVNEVHFKGRTLFIGIVRDITERKRMQEQVRKAQNLESLGILAGGIAHDFNNMLTGVIGNFALLELVLDKGSDAYKMAENGKRAADQSKDLAKQLLTFAKGGAPIKEAVSIAEVIREAAEFAMEHASVEYHVAEPLSPVHADREQIRRVIQNLVSNAEQAMPKGGTLIISAKNVELADQDPLPLAAGHYVKVAVEDPGIGMSEEIMAKVFDPYYTTKQINRGLGLSIVYSIVKRHSGHIEVRSQKDMGTTFEFYLPSLQKRTPYSVATKQVPEGTRAVGRILLMDDEEMIHKAMGMMLTVMGHEVESAYDGAEALQCYQTGLEKDQPFDLVIMDLAVPGGMGGKEAIGKLHEMDPQAVALVSSGYANDPVMAQYAEYGFAGKIAKPVGVEELAAAVQGVLQATDTNVVHSPGDE